MDYKQVGGMIGELNPKDNPRWPPIIGETVVIKTPNYKEFFIGRTLTNIWNNTACIIALLNNNDYIDTTIARNNLVGNNSGKGVFLLLPAYGWKYIDNKTLNIMLRTTDTDLISRINKNIQQKYGEMTQGIAPKTQTELVIDNQYTDDSRCEGDRCKVEDKFKDTSLLTQDGQLDMNGLFRDKEVNKIIFDIKDNFIQPSKRTMKLLTEKLLSNEEVKEEDKRIIVNKSIAIRNMITSKEDEINEGRKIVQWLALNIIPVSIDGSKTFSDLKVSIFNGYIHLSRKGLKVDDIITQDLIPDLKYFRWQYGIPIDYDSLKFTLFQNNFQRNLEEDKEQQDEAERILSQEYLISLQPEPQYQIWALKRLIMCWYADRELQYNIRKIKVLINQWRARADVDFNKRYGAMPSIVVYPRYGKESAKKVLTKLSNYFLLYNYTGWKCAKPSYFVKLNDLVWYTNGAIDLKLYFKATHNDYAGKVSNTSFKDKMTHLNPAEYIVKEYPRR